MEELTYKGYISKPFWSEDDQCYYGKIDDINDLVNYTSDDAEGIEAEFRETVDDYLEFCSEVGREPDHPNRIS